jgi:hypothetical protein
MGVFWTRFLKRTAIALGLVVAIALIVNAFMAWRAERRLQAALASIRAAGEPASIAELAPKPIRDDQNAAALLDRIAPRINAFAGEEGRFSTTPLGEEYDEADDRGESPTPKHIAAIRAIVDHYPDVEEALIAVAACDQYASRQDFSLDQQQFIQEFLKIQGPIRQATRFLVYKNILDLADGQHERAVERGIRNLRLARLYDNEPLLVSLLVGVAVRVHAIDSLYDGLAAGPVSAEMHAALDAELARHDTPQRLVNALKTERALGAEWFDSLNTGQLFLAHTFGWYMKGFQIGVIEAMNELVRLAERPWHEVREQFGAPDSPSLPSGHGVMADLLVPAVRASFHANARGLAMIRSLRIFNALRRFAEQHGREAKSLAELDLPEASTIDPYSGKPLKLMRAEDGWVVYSVMENGKDDGGDFIGHQDYGVAPPKLRLTEKQL